MRRRMCAFLVCAGVAAAAWGAEPETGAPAGKFASWRHEAMRKLGRGASNIGRAGTEFYVQPRDAARTSGSRMAMLWPGMGEAFGMCLTRLTGGLAEAVTFAVPFPNGWQPLLDE